MLRIQKRTALPVWKSWLIRAIAIIIALVLNGVLIYGLTKMNPVKVYATMFNGVFGTERRIWNTIRDISMLLCIGIGLAPAFKMKFWNIGAEGQILLGGIAAAACMMYFDSLPNGLLLVVMFHSGNFKSKAEHKRNSVHTDDELYCNSAYVILRYFLGELLWFQHRRNDQP